MVVVGLTMNTGQTWAQVNTEKLRTWSKPGYGGHVDGSLSWRTGNVEQLEVGTGFRAQYARFGIRTSTVGVSAPPIEHIYLIGHLAVGIQGSDRFKNSGFLHLRYTRYFGAWCASEVFAQAQYNEFVRLTQRQLLGLGGRVEVIRDELIELATATGIMLEYERQDVPEDGPDARDIFSIRSTSYVSLKVYAEAPKLTAVNTVYVQPRLDVPSDIRVLNEGEVSVALMQSVEFALAFSLRFDSRPVTGIDQVDTRLVNKLRLVF